jgi:hypothetical protein
MGWSWWHAAEDWAQVSVQHVYIQDRLGACMVDVRSHPIFTPFMRTAVAPRQVVMTRSLQSLDTLWQQGYFTTANP